ncbi:MAG: hypothetical protein ACJ739_06675 [Acidimicrobiales bacterium]
MNEEPDGGRPEAAPRWRRWLRWTILFTGIAGLAIVTRQVLSADEDAIPSLGVAIVAVLLQGLAGLAASQVWITVLGPGVDARRARAAMLESQLSKYVPAGGMVQALGQVALTTSETVTMRRSAVAWFSSVVLTVIAGMTLLGGFAAIGALDGWVQAIALLGPLSLLLLDRRCLRFVLAVGRRFSTRVPEPTSLPQSRVLMEGLGWAAAGFVLLATSFMLILGDLDAGVDSLEVMAAFVAAWLVGFLLVPLPAGLGAREAVLVALIPGSTTGQLLAASLAQRLLAFAAEVVLVLGHRALSRRGR